MFLDLVSNICAHHYFAVEREEAQPDLLQIFKHELLVLVQTYLQIFLRGYSIQRCLQRSPHEFYALLVTDQLLQLDIPLFFHSYSLNCVILLSFIES